MARWRGILGLLLFSLLFSLLCAAASAQGEEPANAILLVAKAGMLDPNFRETVVLVTQTADSSTVGVILNRPTGQRHPRTAEPLYFGGPVMREVVVALFRAERAPQAAAFRVLKDVYLSMHPENVEPLLEQLPGARYRLYMGFAGWAPRQLEGEMKRGDWHVLAPSEEIAFRRDTSRLWEELERKARGRVAVN